MNRAGFERHERGSAKEILPCTRCAGFRPSVRLPAGLTPPGLNGRVCGISR